MKRLKSNNELIAVVFISIFINICLLCITAAADAEQAALQKDIEVSINCQPMKNCEITYRNKSKTTSFSNIRCEMSYRPSQYFPVENHNVVFEKMILPGKTEISTVSAMFGKPEENNIKIRLISAIPENQRNQTPKNVTKGNKEKQSQQREKVVVRQAFPSVAASTLHSFVKKTDGSVWIWGKNPFSTTTAPIQISGLQDIAEIGLGFVHGLAVKKDGTVWTWGNNLAGQLGDGTTTNSNNPRTVKGLSNVISATGGLFHSVALKSDGTVWAWGGNAQGQLGNGTTDNSLLPVQVKGMSSIVAISSGINHVLALRKDGTVWSWGENKEGQLGDGTTNNSTVPVRVKGLNGVMSITSVSYDSYALKSDGTVWAWGWGRTQGAQTENVAFIDKTVPQHVQTLTGIKSIGTVTFNNINLKNIALKNDGTVWEWQSSMANKDKIVNLTARIPVLTDIIAISAGPIHCIALKRDGTVWTWGFNGNEQLGNGTTITSLTPVLVKNFSWK